MPSEKIMPAQETDFTKRIDKTDIADDGRKGPNDKKIKAAAAAYLEGLKSSLMKDGKLTAEDKAFLNKDVAKVIELIKRHDAEHLDLKKEFERLTSELRKEVTGKIENAKILNIAETIRGALQTESDSAQKIIAELHEREIGTLSLLKDFTSKKGFFNYISPENAMGLAGLINGETFTGAQLESMRRFGFETMQNNMQLTKLINRLKRGETFHEAKKDPSVKNFLESPEGKFFSDCISGTQGNKALNNYYLNKARKLKNSGEFKCEYLAQAYYEKLDHTEYAAIAAKEGLTKKEKRMKSLTEFGNSFLSMDQLAVLALGGSVGRLGANIISRSMTLSKGVAAAKGVIEGSKALSLLSRVIPGVTVLKTAGGEGALRLGGKLLLNLGVEVGKFTAIEKTVSHFYGKEAGQMTALFMMILPGAKAGFEHQFHVNLARDAKAGGEFAKYIFEKHGEEGTRKMIETALKEKGISDRLRTGRLDKESSKLISDLSMKMTNTLKKMRGPTEMMVAEAADTLLKGNTEKLSKIPVLLKEFYLSGISDKIPESLKGKNVLAWIDENGKINYSKQHLEEKFNVKITSKEWVNHFDGVQLKDHPKSREIIAHMKVLKSHEVTHRILEVHGIKDRIHMKMDNGAIRIFSQEEIAEIIDGSRKISQTELISLEKILQEHLGGGFELIKNGKINRNAMKTFDTKMISKKGGNGLSREKASAKDGGETVFHNELFTSEWGKFKKALSHDSGIDFPKIEKEGVNAIQILKMGPHIINHGNEKSLIAYKEFLQSGEVSKVLHSHYEETGSKSYRATLDIIDGLLNKLEILRNDPERIRGLFGKIGSENEVVNINANLKGRLNKFNEISQNLHINGTLPSREDFRILGLYLNHGEDAVREGYFNTAQRFGAKENLVAALKERIQQIKSKIS